MVHLVRSTVNRPPGCEVCTHRHSHVAVRVRAWGGRTNHATLVHVGNEHAGAFIVHRITVTPCSCVCAWRCIPTDLLYMWITRMRTLIFIQFGTVCACAHLVHLVHLSLLVCECKALHAVPSLHTRVPSMRAFSFVHSSTVHASALLVHMGAVHESAHVIRLDIRPLLLVCMCVAVHTNAHLVFIWTQRL